MSNSLSLDELKAQNAAEEALKAEPPENVIEETEKPDVTQTESETLDANTGEDNEQKPDDDANSSEEDGEESESEEWLKGDLDESQGEKKFSGEDVGIAKARLKAKLTKKLDAKDTEIEELKSRLNTLETSAPPAQQSELQKPKRDDFFDADDQDEAFTDALMDWKLNKHQAGQAAAAASATAEKAQQDNAIKISQGEDDHYERAANLVQKSGISVEKFQTADSAFKQAIDIVVPNGGDDIAAALVSKLGKGSEKVVYNIGVNTDKQAELTKLLKADPSGLEAYGYLVELKLSLNASSKRRTNAPKPAPEIKGDVVTNSSLKAIKKQYQAAKTPQARFDLRRKAKASGAKDVNDW